MIASTLLLLCLGLCTQVLMAAKESRDRASALLELENQTYAALRKMTDELEESRLDLVLIEPADESLTFLSARDREGTPQYNSSGDILWTTAIRYHRDSRENRLLKSVAELGVPTETPENPLTLGLDSAGFGSLTLFDNLIIRDCSSFRLTFVERNGHPGDSGDGTALDWAPHEPTPPNTWAQASRVRISVLITKTINRREYGLELESSIKCRN